MSLSYWYGLWAITSTIENEHQRDREFYAQQTWQPPQPTYAEPRLTGRYQPQQTYYAPQSHATRGWRSRPFN